jgi:hypothetical protein
MAQVSDVRGRDADAEKIGNRGNAGIAGGSSNRR